MSYYKVLVNVCPPTLAKEEVSVNIGFKGGGLHGQLPRTWSIQSKIEMNAQIVFSLKRVTTIKLLALSQRLSLTVSQVMQFLTKRN